MKRAEQGMSSNKVRSIALRNERFVLGGDVRKFEEEFARYRGVKYAVSIDPLKYLATSFSESY